MTNNTRYWPRVGMYVTMEFAEQWIEKMNTGEGIGGKYLNDDIEEYTKPELIPASTLRGEIKALFDAPYEEVELDEGTLAILKIAKLESNRISRIKELKAEGYDLTEAKELVTQEINLAVAEVMGIDLEEFEERENARISEAKKEGANEAEAPPNDNQE